MSAVIGSAATPMMSICCTAARHRRRLPATGMMRGSVSRARPNCSVRAPASSTPDNVKRPTRAERASREHHLASQSAMKMRSSSAPSATTLASPRSPTTRSRTAVASDASVAASSSVAIAEVSRWDASGEVDGHSRRREPHRSRRAGRAADGETNRPSRCRSTTTMIPSPGAATRRTARWQRRDARAHAQNSFFLIRAGITGVSCS